MAASQSILQIMLMKEAEKVEATILLDNITDFLMADSPQAKRTLPFRDLEVLASLRSEYSF